MSSDGLATPIMHLPTVPKVASNSTPEEKFSFEIGTKIKLARTYRQMSQTELARKAGLTRQYVSKIEKGQCCVTTRCLLRIVDILNCEISVNFKLKEYAEK